MKVSDYICEYLIDKEVTHVFGMSGANIEDLYSAIYRKNKPSIILAKNEYNASTMAIGSYLATKKVPVVLTTSGPGFLNTVPVLAEAFTSRIPMVIISGTIPEPLEGLGVFQDTSGKGGSLDLLKIIKECSCFQVKIENPNDVPKALHDAFMNSMKMKKPSVVLIPKDIFNKKILPYHYLMTFSFPSLKKESVLAEISNSIDFCHQFSHEDKVSPLVILGEELINLKDMGIVKQFIEKIDASVALTPNSKGLFDHRSDRFLGLIGIMGHEEVIDYLKQTDHLILIGVNFDLSNRYGIEKLISSKKILIIKEEQSLDLFCYRSEIVCETYGDIENSIQRISSSIALKSKKNLNMKKEKKEENENEYNLKNIIKEIEKVIDFEGNIFIDAGNAGAFVIHHLMTAGNGICYVSLGMGGMGNSIGAGIGGAAVTKKKSYVFLGDGSFLMYGLEIHTALEYGLPVIFFIFNNNAHGMCSTREKVFLQGETGINNFKKSFYADGLEKIFPGIFCYEVSDIDYLKQSLSEIKERKSSCVMAINISNSEDPPFRTFKRNN